MKIEEKKARQDRKLARECERRKMEIEKLKAEQLGKVKFTAKTPTGMEFTTEGTDDQVVKLASMMNKMYHKQQKALM